ncbi:MAG: carbohydrate binding domain-containing protein [Ruminococcus sp.]|nr:carbohydrate binding domain-containing protein [Ruminococcus sp.]
MKIRTIAGRFVSAVTASAMIITGFAFAPSENLTDTYAADNVVIDTTKTYQNIRGFGGINHPEWTGADLSAAQRQTAFGNGDNELGLTVLRVFVNPDSSQWKLALPTAQYATQKGVTIFASPWEPPANLAESGGSNGKLHIPKSNYGAYAEHLNNFGQYMKDNNVDLYSISVQNEPDYASEWTYWSTDETTDFIANYGDKITSTRLMSPESFQYAPENASWVSDGGKKFYTKILNNAKAMANCDVFGTHMYGTAREWMDFPALENCGKEIWMTEVYVPNSEADSANRYPEAIQVSENIHNAMVVGNMSAYTWWYIRRSYGLMTEDGKISKRGYCMAQYSKYVRPGAVRIEATEQPSKDVLVSAYKKDNTITVVAINKGTEGYAQSFTVGSGEKIVDVDRYRTSANENLAKTENLENDGTKFFAQLPGESVSTFIITLDGEGNTNPTNPETPDKPNEYGWYFQCGFEDGEQDWTARGGNKVSQSNAEHYTEWGSNSLLVSDRTSAWNGAAYLLNSHAFEAGKEYSFSAHVKQKSGKNVKFMMKLEYTNAAGETDYSEIASVTAPDDKWAQLINTNYKIPEGASNVKIYIETEESLTDFYVDEVIGAVGGTGIAGEGQPALSQTTNPVVTPTDKVIAGDINSDKEVDVFDMIEMRKLLASNFADAPASADTNGDGEFSIADAVALQQYLVGQIKELKSNVVSSSPSKPMRTISEYTPLVEVSEYETDDSKTEKAGVNYGTLEKKSYYSNFCGRNKKYNVLLPANYDKNKKYPVLYVMHGYWEDQDRMILTGNDHIPTQQIIGNAIAEGAAKEMIVVFPYIYSSQTQDNCSAMDDANNQAYDNFDTVLTTELMPLIEKEYSVATGRENTAITGFSMGGREALMIGMKHPDLFGYMGAICAAPGATGAFKFASEEEAPSLIFLTAGSNDQTVYNTPEGYHNSFTSNGVPHIWHYVNGGYHGDNCIRAHIYNFVRAIFKA